MLRTIRKTLAVISFVLITFLFLDFTGTLHDWFGWLAKIQLVPAILAINLSVIILLLLLTVLFGRIYCSIICPLGVLQDIIARFGRKGKKLPYSFTPAINWLRYGSLIVFVVALVAGVSPIFTILEPYSAYGRIASSFFTPIYQLGNNYLASLAEKANSYAFYETDIWIKGSLILSITTVTFLIITILAWRNGRTYCNTICPVGTILGFVSKYSIFRPIIETSHCNSCGVCARNCKASCIDSKNHKIDYSRCVSCMNCIQKCSHGAITFTSILKKRKGNEILIEPIVKKERHLSSSRRRFFATGTGIAVSSLLKAQEMKVDGGFIDLEEKKIPKRGTFIAPPGSRSLNNLTQHCTACQLCVSVCENQVLRPTMELNRFMQPEMSFERGYCRPECVKCSEVCPTSAIKLISTADKSAIQIGHAVWIKDNCVVLKDGVSCDNCQRHCPTSAIQMIPSVQEDADSLKIPIIDVEHCIGCGACENLCPARPYSAIYVEGHLMHRVI